MTEITSCVRDVKFKWHELLFSPVSTLQQQQQATHAPASLSPPRLLPAAVERPVTSQDTHGRGAPALTPAGALCLKLIVFEKNS